jgi:hypothetical protein
VNGVPVTGVAEQERGLTAVPVPKGNVLISADWTTTEDVVAGRSVSAAALLLLTCLFLFERKQLRAHRNQDGPDLPDSTKKPKLLKVEPKDSISSTRMGRRNTPSGKQEKNVRGKKPRKPEHGAVK